MVDEWWSPGRAYGIQGAIHARWHQDDADGCHAGIKESQPIVDSSRLVLPLEAKPTLGSDGEVFWRTKQLTLDCKASEDTAKLGLGTRAADVDKSCQGFIANTDLQDF